MKTLGFLSLVGVVLGVVPVTAGRQAPSAEPFDLTVFVQARAPRVTGSPSEHFLAFNTPVRVPQADLPAGPYIFTHVSAVAVRVTSVDRAKVYSTFLTLPVSRNANLNRGEVRFRRDPAGGPLRIAAVFQEGSSVGWEPVYQRGATEASPRDRTE
jgi:hypothetical protein